MNYGFKGIPLSSISRSFVASVISRKLKAILASLKIEEMKVYFLDTHLKEMPIDAIIKGLGKIVESADIKVDEGLDFPRRNEVDYPTYEEVIEEDEHEALEEKQPQLTTLSTLNNQKKPIRYVEKNHPKDQIIGGLRTSVQTRRRIAPSQEHINYSLVSHIEPKFMVKACKVEHFIEAMEEELDQI